MTLLLDVFLPVLVVLIMTIVGMDLRFTDFLRVRRYPLLVPATIVSQWVAAILVAVLVGRLLELPQAVAGGVLLLAAAPVASLSNYYTQLARGHLALAVTVTAVSNVFAVVATPLVATIGFRMFLGENASVELPLVRLVQQTVAVLLLPLLVGMSIRHCAAAWTLRFRSQLQLLAALAIATVFGFVVVNQSTAIGKYFGTLLATSLLFTLTTLGIGLIVVRLLTRSVRDRRALLWGFPARNVAVAVFIATAVVGQAEMASFAAVLLATQLALFVPLGGGRKLHRWRCGRNLHTPAGWRFR